MHKQTDDAEPHFKVGVAGRLARFFIARRAAGDPFDATLVLPCVIFLALARLNDLGRVGRPGRNCRVGDTGLDSRV